MAPVAAPGADGLKVTGTLSWSPAFMVTGKLVTGDPVPPAGVRMAWPALNGFVPPVALTVGWLTLMLAVAVRVAVWVCDPPTASWNASGVAPVSAGACGLPNPSTWPSLVPTNTRPSLVAGMQNLLAVPIGDDQICVS